MNHEVNDSNANGRRSVNPAAAILWASAFVIAAMIIVQAGQFEGQSAYAGTAAGAGGYTMVTARSGKGTVDEPRDLLYVVDDRSDMLLVYEIENVQTNRMILRYAQNLADWFGRAR